MYNAQILVDRINNRIKVFGFSQKQLLKECGINVNSLNQMSDKKGIASFSLAKIADRLECSVDYLLGRTENPNISFNTHVDGDNTGIIANNNSGTLHHVSTNTCDDELLELFNGLTLVQKAEAIMFISKLKSGE